MPASGRCSALDRNRESSQKVRPTNPASGRLCRKGFEALRGPLVVDRCRPGRGRMHSGRACRWHRWERRGGWLPTSRRDWLPAGPAVFTHRPRRSVLPEGSAQLALITASPTDSRSKSLDSLPARSLGALPQRPAGVTSCPARSPVRPAISHGREPSSDDRPASGEVWAARPASELSRHSLPMLPPSQLWSACRDHLSSCHR